MKPGGSGGSLAGDRIEKLLRLAGTLFLGGVLLTVPAFFGIFGLNGRASALQAEAAFLGQEVERIIHDRPELWEYETLRMQEITDRAGPAGAETKRSVLKVDGRPLAENGIRLAPPALRVEVPVHDSGRVVARFVVERSWRDLAVKSGLGALLALAVAFLASWLLRALPMRFVAALRDQLNSERRRSETILEAIQEGVVALDDGGRLLLVNPVATRLVGTAEGTEGTDRLLRFIGGLSRNGEGRIQDRVALELPDGSSRTLELREFPIPLSGTEAQGRVVLFRDITEKLHFEAEELRARQLESLGLLAGGIAHDFNNFLTAIQGNVSLAQARAGSDPGIQEPLERALQSTRRAHAVSNRLLTFAKGGEPARTIMELPAVVQEATGFALQGSGIDCRYDFQPDLARIEGDAGQISQVFLNLVLNANQAMVGTGSLRIQARNLFVDDGEVPNLEAGPYVRVTVADSGPGIPAAIRDRIFEPYFTTKSAGSGLGLASAYRIVKAHGGNIFAEDGDTGGACFTLYFPASGGAFSAIPQPPPVEGMGQGERILVMDDDPLIQAVCQGLLEFHGFAVSVVSEGQEAADRYAEARAAGHPFRAVILDLTVPGGLGGKEAAELILRKDPAARLIASSGYSDDPVMAAPVAFGFSAALPKPYTDSELMGALSPLLASIARPEAKPVG